MPVSKLTSKNQTTVPREVRDRLGIGSGDALEWSLEEGSVRVRAVRSSLDRLRGIFKVGRGDVVADVKRGRALRGRTAR